MLFSTDDIVQLNANPLYQTIGLQVISARGGKSVSQLKPVDRVCWPSPEQPHGGILFTQMDTTMAWAALSMAGEGSNCSTISMDIQYPSPAKGSVFNCEALAVHATWRSCFIKGEILNEAGTVVAMSQATFRIIRQQSKT